MLYVLFFVICVCLYVLFKLDLRLLLVNVWSQGIKTDENGTQVGRTNVKSETFDVRTVSWADGSQWTPAAQNSWQIVFLWYRFLLHYATPYTIILDFEIPSGWRLNIFHIVDKMICDEAATSNIRSAVWFGSTGWWSSVCLQTLRAENGDFNWFNMSYYQCDTKFDVDCDCVFFYFFIFSLPICIIAMSTHCYDPVLRL